MHPRNPYRQAPDFKTLAAVHPPLSAFLQGRTLDFQDDEAQRCLTQALLKRDFNIELELPHDRLCPPVLPGLSLWPPNLDVDRKFFVRLNYVLWIQDIVSALKRVIREREADVVDEWEIGVCGLDIGTGASAIYPLLSTSLEESWRFVASELDPKSFEYAKQNVQRNGLHDRIAVVPVSPSCSSSSPPPATSDNIHFGFDELFQASPTPTTPRLGHPTADAGQDLAREGHGSSPSSAIQQTCEIYEIQFTMCNPPFYSSSEDVAASNGAKEEGAFGVCTGAPVEMITAGGEARFVGAMVRESLRLSCVKQRNDDQETSEDRPCKRQKSGDGKPLDPGILQPSVRKTVRWYTSMLGKMSSVGEIVAEFRRLKVSNYAITEFVQGQTRRWAVGWSLDTYRLPDELCRLPKPNSTLQPLMPPHNTLRLSLPESQDHQLDEWLDKLEDILVKSGELSVIRTSGPTLDLETLVDSPPVTYTAMLVIRAADDCWSRSARRKRARGAIQHPSTPDTSHSNTALVCSMRVEGRELVSRWLYGCERGLFESFVSHVTRAILKSARPQGS